MAEEKNNAVHQLPILPPGYRFQPTNPELFRRYLYDRVTKGFCQWNIIPDTDILAVPPWDLPGMKESNENECYYFSARERKSDGAGFNRNNRRIKTDNNAFWKMSAPSDVWEEGLKWGNKNTLNFYSRSGKKTDWLMYEFVLDPSLAKGSNREHIVLYKVYKKKDSKELGTKRGRPAREGSDPNPKGAEIVPLHDIDSGQPLKRRRMNAAADSSSAANCFPQLNQKTQSGNGTSSSSALYIAGTTHSEVATPPPAASFSSAEPYNEEIHPAPEAEPCTTNHCAYATPCTSTIVAPVDDPKLCYQPAAFGSAEPHTQETLPVAAAAPCTTAASSLSCVAPTDDPNMFYTDAEWEQEIQNFLGFDPADRLDDLDHFNEEFFAPFFRI